MEKGWEGKVVGNRSKEGEKKKGKKRESDAIEKVEKGKDTVGN